MINGRKRIAEIANRKAKERGIFGMAGGLQRPAAEKILKEFGNPYWLVWNDPWRYTDYGKEVTNPDHGFTWFE